jgi:hypothetical protein
MRDLNGPKMNLFNQKNTGNNSKAGHGLFWSRDFVTSGEKGPTTADIAQHPVTHAQNILPYMASSGHVTSGHFRSCHFWSSMRNDPIPLDPPQMLLFNHQYTTFFHIFQLSAPSPPFYFHYPCPTSIDPGIRELFLH